MNDCCDMNEKDRKNNSACSNRTKKKRSLEEVFKQVNRDYVKIKRKEKKRNNDILFSVLGELLKIMRKHDKMFNSMKPELEYLGSYYDGLRVGHPTEYDLNVILKLPVDYNKIYLDAETSALDCTHIYMSSEFRRLCKIPATMEVGYAETELWCDQKFRLSVKKFRSWMQSIVDKAMATLPLVNNKRNLFVKNKSYLLSTKTSGPASTIMIIPGNEDKNVIDVDLVPTFSFELSKKPFRSKILFKIIENDERLKKKNKYFAVPKPSEDEYSWRLAFPFQERTLIYGKYNMKSAAKLLKLLRDVQDFKGLASYYIKTIFLWESKRQKDDFWKNNSMSYLVVHMLKKMKESLGKGEIKSFWCPQVNLIKGKIKMETCKNWSNRLAFIIRNIEQKGRQNPELVAEYFTKRY